MQAKCHLVWSICTFNSKFQWEVVIMALNAAKPIRKNKNRKLEIEKQHLQQPYIYPTCYIYKLSKDQSEKATKK